MAKNHRLKTLQLLVTWSLINLMLGTTSSAATILAKQKITSEEIIARHLDSIGSAEARAAAKTRVIAGTAVATFRGRGTGNVEGRAVFASEDTKNLFGMAFGTPNYSGEKVGFDGKDLTVGYLRPGIRSSLGSFLLIHESAFRHGLIGGTLSSGWTLLNPTPNAKLEYAGVETINGRMLHKVKYSPRKGSDLRITLFFDTKNFRHLRTQYERVIATRLGGGGVDNQASQLETRYKMTEDFSNFKTEGSLTLPHNYNLQLDIESNNGSINYDWKLNLLQFSFNQPIDIKDFNVSLN